MPKHRNVEDLEIIIALQETTLQPSFLNLVAFENMITFKELVVLQF